MIDHIDPTGKSIAVQSKYSLFSSYPWQGKPTSEPCPLCSTSDVASCFMLPAVSQRWPQPFTVHWWNSLHTFSVSHRVTLCDSRSTFHYSSSHIDSTGCSKQDMSLGATISYSSDVSERLLMSVLSN